MKRQYLVAIALSLVVSIANAQSTGPLRSAEVPGDVLKALGLGQLKVIPSMEYPGDSPAKDTESPLVSKQPTSQRELVVQAMATVELMNRRVEVLEAEVAQIKFDIEPAREAVLQTKLGLEKSQQGVSKATSEIDDFQSAVSGAQSDYQQLEPAFSQVQLDVKKGQQLVSQIKSELEPLLNDVSQLGSQQKQAQRKVFDAETLIAMFQRRVVRSKERIEKLGDEHKKTSGEIVTQTDLIEDLRPIQEELKYLADTFDDAEVASNVEALVTTMTNKEKENAEKRAALVTNARVTEKTQQRLLVAKREAKQKKQVVTLAKTEVKQVDQQLFAAENQVEQKQDIIEKAQLNLAEMNQRFLMVQREMTQQQNVVDLAKLDLLEANKRLLTVQQDVEQQQITLNSTTSLVDDLVNNLETAEDQLRSTKSAAEEAVKELVRIESQLAKPSESVSVQGSEQTVPR